MPSKVHSICQPPYWSHNAIHRILDSRKLMNPAPLALDMLAQRAQRRESHTTRAHRADINLVLMARACQVLIQRTKAAVRPMAQITLVRFPIPRGVRRVVRDLLVDATAGSGEHTRGVGNDVFCVELPDLVVEEVAVHAGAAGARFEVEKHGGRGDEGEGAAFATAGYVARTVGGRVEVRLEIAR